MCSDWSKFKICFLGLAILLSIGVANGYAEEEEGDPAEIGIGERLFLETRFAQFFFQNSDGDANSSIGAGDPVLFETETLGEPLPGPFTGQSMNCRACHLVDEHLEAPGGGMRTYTDFARRSPIPDRPIHQGGDGLTHAPRNSPPLVNASLDRQGGLLLHFDAEFTTMEDLVQSTLTGRNYGWLASEFGQAISHIAHIIRNDNGEGELAQEFGGSYKEVLRGNPRDADGNLMPELVLPPELQIDIDDPSVQDIDIFSRVAELIAIYTVDLAFSQDETGAFNLSPFDVFLVKNGLDRNPQSGESEQEYSRRLLKEIDDLDEVQFVEDPADGSFAFHNQAYAFGPEELEGMKIFFRETPEESDTGAGNCIACHQAPNFTDFNFHNTGATQKEFDAIHGDSAFRKLRIPGLFKRWWRHEAFLPPTPQHPGGTGKFRSIPSAKNKHTDLGLWNVFANPDFPKPQDRLWQILCEKRLGRTFDSFEHFGKREFFMVLRKCRVRKLLKKSIALFKTPGLRDLGHSAPYMHNGQEDTLEDVVNFYIESSDLARARRLRNGAPELKDIRLGPEDVAPLVKFMKSLNEDYE